MIKVEHCVSEHMIADFFTKPIKGLRFQYLRDVVLNITFDCAQERVGKQ